ncbi:MAG: sigma-70 family RNA polymerase sigma factor [Fimbriimonas sp.]|nr:sigma-70 family RNA polymerase sigma factor [Fimbriimonas sp.]
MTNPPRPSEKRSAFALIARQHEANLLRAAKRMCGLDHDLAQDLVQETLVSAYRAYLDGRFDGRHPGAWLTRILTNAFLFAKRQNRTLPGLESELLPNDDTFGVSWNSKIPSPEERLMQGTLSESLERALMSLPESQRLCVILADIEELPYAEIAEVMEVPIGTVRSRLARARMQMLTVLRDLQKLDSLS